MNAALAGVLAALILLWVFPGVFYVLVVVALVIAWPPLAIPVIFFAVYWFLYD
jgi:hypothetical protein